MSFVEMQGIGKRFGATVALDGVDLFLEQGEVHALVGENGSGKSTLMRVLAGVMARDEGTMRLDGKEYNPRSPMEARRAGVAMIHQELALCPDLSVAENVLLGMEDAAFGVLNRSEMRARAKEALSKLGHGDLDLDIPVKQLPIGVCQIIEIARAVAVGSRVVILDEPTSSLSEPDVLQLFEVIRALKATGHALVYISHFLDEIEAIADRITVLRDGENIVTKLAGEMTQAEIVSSMVGRDIESIYPHTDRVPGTPLLSVEFMSGATKPINANLVLHAGEVVGIAGLNGSGRTELARCIFSLDPVVSGKVKVKAFEGTSTPHQRWQQGVGMLSEDRKLEGLALNLSIADNLTLTRLPRVISDRSQLADAEHWVSAASIKCREPRQAVGELSGGNQQKVAFARLLYHDVDVLLLDEPTRGIDVGSKQQIYGMIDELAKSGKAVLMISSYLPELLGVCDRIAVMHKGALGEAKPVRSIDQESIMREATGV